MADGRREISVYESIVVGTDGSETAAEAVKRAVELARALSAKLHVVSAYRMHQTGAGVYPEAGIALADEEWRIRPRVETDAMLEELDQSLAGEGIKAVTHSVPGDPAHAILTIAREVEAGVVVVGNKGMRGVRRVLGSVPNSVSHEAPCDVLIVHTT
jgi:nucleotide-binding universal stress UspA family protein